VVRRGEKRKRVIREKRRDEESLYYVLERDLDREAIFPGHDGWYSQIAFGKRKRIDYVVKYGGRVYGIEVKKDFPKDKHFEQAERYRNALDGIFLAYPSDGVGQAVYVSEIKESKFPDVGLVSLTLFRSHIIRKAKQNERQSEQIWKDLLLDDKEYLSHVAKEWEPEQLDRISKTVLKDGCFWVSFSRTFEESEDLHEFSLCETDWRGLALLYGASAATSFHRYFSIEDLWKRFCKDLGWAGFQLGKLELSGLASSRTYGNLLWMWTLSEASILLMDKIRKALKEHLGESEWVRLNERVNGWKLDHNQIQTRCEKEFIT